MSCERLVPWHEQQRSLDTKERAEDEAAALTPAQGPLLLPCAVEFCLLVVVFRWAGLFFLHWGRVTSPPWCPTVIRVQIPTTEWTRDRVSPIKGVQRRPCQKPKLEAPGTTFSAFPEKVLYSPLQ